MKLGKLLAAGKSIMNGRTEISYRSSKQIYLPKFGSARNPFKPDASAQAAEMTPDAESARSANGATSDIHAPAATERRASAIGTETIAAEKLCVHSCLSVSAAGPAKTLPSANRDAVPAPVAHDADAASKRLASPQRREGRVENASTLQRFNVFLRSALGKNRSSEKSAKTQTGTATQTELSLDSVKVVHNDLSDVDVEVVPIKSRSGAPELPAPKKSWEYVGERLFGVEAT
ncbi:MAG TPA: hypothetical protein VME24_11990 [Alphaproteobacteria bacterium]|nr:hypothetical protein [Alphaproteobacteria bacterium]